MPSCGSVWYQTTDTFPASPAAIHGQSTRVPGCATVSGADHVFPRSFVEIIMIELGAGVCAPLRGDLIAAESAVDEYATLADGHDLKRSHWDAALAASVALERGRFEDAA